MTKKTVIILITLAVVAECKKENMASKSKNPFPYFRRQVEEVNEDSSVGFINDDPKNNLVSFLVKNVKEIFNEITDLNESTKQPIVTIAPSQSSATYDLTISLKENPYKKIRTTSNTDDLKIYKNMSLSFKLVDGNHPEPIMDKDTTERQLIKSQLMILTKEMDKSLEALEKTDLNMFDPTVSTASRYLGTNETYRSGEEYKRSCISCNNVLFDNCDDPQNKIIPSVTCTRDDDICYSLHTPFGIIDRGCYNVNENLSTYVCACNLCNYLSISEMPYTFTSKYHWVDNVVELASSRKLRKSVYKDMACLRCEVNTTSRMGDMLDSANCMEGNIANLPTQKCAENEVCAVKALKKDGYIWRGCVNFPLYNYWIALCENDLCNYDSLIYMYDFIT